LLRLNDGCNINKLLSRKMKKLYTALFISVFAFSIELQAQNRYFTREGIVFFTVNYLEKNLTISNSNISCTIENNRVNLTSQAGKFKFNNLELKNKMVLSNNDSVKIKGAVLKGEIAGFDSIDFKVNKTYQMVIKGNIMINKNDQKVEFPIEVKVTDKIVYLKSKLILNLNDFVLLDEKNPLKKNENIEISFDFALNPLR
jgi:hypothetical protein